MKLYEINGLGKDWRWTGESEDEAIASYIYDICGALTLEDYEEYCDSVHVDKAIWATEVLSV